ncbi:hypothetical protein B566_EDAN016159 [Ephemera danica]|nr:hypothetical protein B566_EDAN016159 [Ephemera danica]
MFRFIVMLIFLFYICMYIGHNRKHRTLKITAVPSIYNVDDTGSPAEDFAASQLPPHHQDQEDEMQIDTLDDVIRPPDMLCAIYSLPDANPAELDTQVPVLSSQCRANNTQVLDTTDDMDSFYSRCLLCTCRPDATPHLEIFSEAGNHLKLAEKINKYLNIQIKQQSRSLDTEAEQDSMDTDSNCSVIGSELDPLEPTIDYAEENTIDVPLTGERDDLDSNCSGVDFDQSSNDPIVQSSEEPKCDTVCETTSKSDIFPEKPEVCRPTEEAEKDGVSEEDFVKCLQCTFVIYKNYMAFHVKTHHGEMTPVVPKIIDETIMKQMQQQTRRSLILDWRMCTICKTRFYSQVLDLHMLLRHTEPSADNSEKAEDLPTTDLSRLKQCPACPCMFFPESMQGHIAEEHPPTPNPDLEKPMMQEFQELRL